MRSRRPTTDGCVVAYYKHLIGGEAYGIVHEPGDPVTSRAPKRKIAEWLKAGVIEKVAGFEETDEGEDLESA